MASALDPLVSAEQRCNSARLGRLIFREGTVVLRSLFDSFHPPSTLAAVLRSNKRILRSLLAKKLLSPAEWKILFPDHGSLSSSQNMEARLLFLLLQNICGLPEPIAGWNNPPSSPSDSNHLQEKLAKLKWFVNEVAKRASGVETHYFNVFYWNQIFDVLSNLGISFPYSSELLKDQSLDEYEVGEYHKLLVDWAAKENEIQNNQERDINTVNITSNIGGYQPITPGVQEGVELLKSVVQLQEETKRGLLQDMGKRPFTWSKSSLIAMGCKGTKVYRGNLSPDGKVVAVKRMFLGVFDKDEAEKLRRCEHENIIRCFATYEEDDFFYLALEMCEKTLKVCIDEHRFDAVYGDLSIPKCFTEVTSGVAYLHRNKICHRDIKPDNILLAAESDKYRYQRFVLADFNCARDVRGNTFSTENSVVGTLGWMAPEMCQPGKKRTLKVDIFSLGCVFYYTLTNKKHPYGDIANVDECQYRINTRQIPELKLSLQGFMKNDDFIDLIEKMVHPDADSRPTANEVYHCVIDLRMKEKLELFLQTSQQEELKELILKRNARNEEVFEWIDRNVEAAKTKEGSFIRDLVTAVCEASVSQPDGNNSSCKCDQEILKSRKNLLQKYIESDSSLELQALYALQSLAVALEHPPGLLQSLFDALYDEDVISEESFYSWERSEDSAESNGKDLALKSTIDFFRWLRSAMEESDDEN